MAQASKVEEVFQQNRDLSQRLVDLKKLWVKEERFTMELHGRVEALQVHWSLWGVCTLIDDQRSIRVDDVGARVRVSPLIGTGDGHLVDTILVVADSRHGDDKMRRW